MRILFFIILLSTQCFAQRTADSVAISKGATCIFYDFDGQYVPAGSGWTTAKSAPQSRVNGSTTVKDSILRFGMESMAAFNAVVTLDSTLFFIAPQGRRIRVIFTDSTSGSNGGESIIGSITNTVSTPVFVYDTVGSTTTKAICGIHEVGHNIGLQHQGKNGSETLSTGYGSGETSFAPFMGNAYLKNVIIWFNGNISNTAATQDDISIIGAKIGYKTPDAGHNFNGARVIQKDKPIVAILSANDSDYFKIYLTTPQTISLSAQPYSLGSNLKSNLDVAIDLYNETGTLVLSSTNTTVINATISQFLRPGTYFIKIRPDRSNTDNLTGYGFMGHYTLTYTY